MSGTVLLIEKDAGLRTLKTEPLFITVRGLEEYFQALRFNNAEELLRYSTNYNTGGIIKKNEDIFKRIKPPVKRFHWICPNCEHQLIDFSNSDENNRVCPTCGMQYTITKTTRRKLYVETAMTNIR